MVNVYDGAFDIVPPYHFMQAEVQTRRETSVYRPAEIPETDRSGVEIALTAAMFVVGAIAIAGSMHLNHRHNQAVTRRMQSKDEGGLVRHHSLQ